MKNTMQRYGLSIMLQELALDFFSKSINFFILLVFLLTVLGTI